MATLEPLPNPDFTRLVEHLKDGVKSVEENDGYPGKDHNHYAFKIAMECLYGKDVWKWWNERANY